MCPTTCPAAPVSMLTIVAPAYNEEDILPAFHGRLAAVLDRMALRAEILYVNDGSADATLAIMRRICAEDPRAGLIDLSRNFGKDVAMTAGLDYARGEAVVVIDTDLQDPPELIPELVRHWQAGYDVVYAQRSARDGDSLFKRATAYCFYRLAAHLSRVPVPCDTGDFRLLSRKAVDALRQLREQHRFMKGLFAWVGFSQTAVPYRRSPRPRGKTKWNYWQLWNFALDGITSFTLAPLRLASCAGLLTALAAFGYAGFVFWKALTHGDPVRGYPSLMLAMLFLGGIQLMTLGIIGEYLGRTLTETKRRPLYLTNGVALASLVASGEQPAHAGGEREG